MPGAASRSSSASKQEWPGLAMALAGFDDARLARLFALRGDLASPPARDWSVLASRAGGWVSARDCYRALDRAAQRVVEALCLLPQPARLTDLAALLGVSHDDDDLASALLRLEERALAFRLGDPPAGEAVEVRLLPALRQLDYPAGLGPPLTALLHSLTGPALEQMAVRLGAKPAGTMAKTRALIAGILSDPAEVARLVESGPGGTADLARRAAADGPLVSVPGGLYGVTDRTAAGWMVNRGLLGVADYYTAVMPREPGVALRGGRIFPPGTLHRPELELSAVDTGAVDRTAAERAVRLVADVTVILDQWSAEPPTVLKAGGLGIREVRKAAKVADRTDPETARIMELATVAGLARVDPLSGAALPTDAYDEWLAGELPARWAWLAAAWLDADLHVSLAGAIGTKEKPIPPLLHRAPERDARHRRRLVLDALEEAPPGQAPVSASLRNRIDWTSPATWAGGPATPQMLVSWTLEETELLGVAALGSLSTAGRMLVAGRPQDAATALAALVPPAVADFVIQADLTAVIAGEPSAAIRTELDLLGDVESKGAATVYRFTEGSLRRAFDAGRSTTDILGFLERHATRGVPQPLTYLVNDLGRRFGNVRVGGAASYLRSDDPALLAEVLQARLTTKLRLRPLAPTVLVTDVDAATVTATLQAAGYLPAREAADGSLLLARPATHRLAHRPSPSYRLPSPPDPAAVVAELRRKPVAAPAPPPPEHRPLAPVSTLPFDLITTRPDEIAKGARAVRALLGEACEEYWLVRLSYVNGNGRSSELTVEPTDLDGRHLYAMCLPGGEERSLVVDRIEWARVLTEAEELHLS
ncbi:MAG: helicase-associated domain-containing protein [Acidimicrobiales bacterium]